MGLPQACESHNIVPPIRDAVEDKAVLPLLHEGRHVLQEANQKAIDPMFESMCEGLTPEQKADLKRLHDHETRGPRCFPGHTQSRSFVAA